MQCPLCKVALQMSEREGIEIDYCPQCRGVWLDRGELDKIIERSAQQPAPRQQEYRPEPRHTSHDSDYKRDSHGHGHKKKRESFLSDLFDFD